MSQTLSGQLAIGASVQWNLKTNCTLRQQLGRAWFATPAYLDASCSLANRHVLPSTVHRRFSIFHLSLHRLSKDCTVDQAFLHKHCRNASKTGLMVARAAAVSGNSKLETTSQSGQSQSGQSQGPLASRNCTSRKARWTFTCLCS